MLRPNQFIFYFGLLAIIFGLNCHQSSEDIEAPPNVLFLFTDDQTYTAVHALGNEVIETPNMDRLIQGGTTFTHAYNMGGWNGAICVASRAMIISGRSLWRAQAFTRQWRQRDSTALQQTWSRIMEQHGYDTYMSGKWHVDAPADVIFRQAKHIRPGMPGDAWPSGSKKVLEHLKGNPNPLNGLAEVMPVGYHRPVDENDNSWSPTDSSFGGFWEGGKHWSEVVADDAIGFLAQAEERENPFFMYVAFNAPHDPRQAPQPYLDKYPIENIKAPENFLEMYPEKDDVGLGISLRDEALAPFPRTVYAVKKHIQEYYAIITHLDDQFGRILEKLEETGMMDNTLIIFSADHGLSVGRHGLIGKQNMYDHSMRIPLVFKGPGIPEGNKIQQDVYLQDIMATTLEVAGIQKPEYVEFNSLMDLIRGDRSQGHHQAIYGAYVDFQRMVRSDGFKLIVYPKANILKLFDLNEDPEEMNNLIDQDEYSGKAKQLFDQLLELQKHYGDNLDLSEEYAMVK